MTDRELVEAFQIEDEHLEDLEAAVGACQGRHAALYAELKARLEASPGSAILAKNKAWFLDDNGAVDSRVLAEGPEDLIDRLMSADWHPPSEGVLADDSPDVFGVDVPRFGFTLPGRSRRRPLIVDGRVVAEIEPTFLGFGDRH